MSSLAIPNPFLQQLQILESNLPASPPPGYAYRLIAQMVLCSVLTLSSLAYVIIATYDHIKRGKRVALFKVTGKLIVLNTLYLYVIIVGLGGVVLAIYTGEKYRVLINKTSPKDLAIFGLLTWAPALLSGWIFVFSTGSAALRSNTNGAFLSSSVGVFLHNATLFAFPLLSLGSTTPLGYMSKKYSDRAVDLLEDIVTLLKQGAAAVVSGQRPQANVLVALQEKSAALEHAQRMISHYGLAILIISMAEVVIYATATAASYTFVLHLRKQARWNAERFQGGSSHSGASRTFTNGPSVPGTPSKKTSFMTSLRSPRSPIFKQSRSAQPVVTPSEETVRLSQLSKDLSLSVPLTCLECVFFVIFGALAGTIVQTSKEWKYREFQMDAFTWGHASIQTCIVAYFIWNALYRPGRFGRGMSSEKSPRSTEGNFRISQGFSRPDDTSFQVRMMPLGKDAEEKSDFVNLMEPKQDSIATYQYEPKDELAYGSVISITRATEVKSEV